MAKKDIAEETECYFCGKVCSVFYPREIRVHVESLDKNNCKVYLVFEVMACRDCSC